jgi:hypothetical protein
MRPRALLMLMADTDHIRDLAARLTFIRTPMIFDDQHL